MEFETKEAYEKMLFNIFYAMTYDLKTKFFFNKEFESVIEITDNKHYVIEFKTDTTHDEIVQVKKVNTQSVGQPPNEHLFEIPKIKAVLFTEYLEEDNRTNDLGVINFIHFFLEQNLSVNQNIDFGDRYFDSNQLEETITKFSQLSGNNYRIIRYSIDKSKRDIAFDFWKKLKPSFNKMLIIEARELINDSINMLKMNNYTGIIQMMTSAILLNNCNSEFYLLRGLSNYYLGYFGEAFVDFNNAIIRNQDSYTAFLYRGHLFKNEENFTKAESDYRRVIELNPGGFDAYLMLGVILIKVDNLINQALKSLLKANQMQPRNINVLFYIGICKFKKNSIDEAIECFESVILLDSNFANVFLNRGVCKYRLGKYNDAISDFSKAIELNQNFSIGYHNRGVCNNKIGNIDKGNSDFAKAHQIDSSFFEKGIPITRKMFQMEPLLVWFES